jgi:hypothetical protein
MGKRRSYQINIARYTAPGAGLMLAKKNILPPGESGGETDSDPWILTETTPISTLVRLMKNGSLKEGKTPERICRPCGSIGAGYQDILLPDHCCTLAFSTKAPYKILYS